LADRNMATDERTIDAELVAEAILDRGSFDALYHRHVRAVRTVVRDNVHDVDEQMDVVQESFAKALAKLHTLSDPASFRPWLLQIARNAAIDHRRRRLRAPLEHLDDHEPVLATGDPSPDDIVEVRELVRQMTRHMVLLSPRDATVLSLVTQLGLGPEEVATALGITAGNAKVILHRTRRRLRTALEADQSLDNRDT